MNFEEKIKIQLLARGFGNETILNNRGLIGAVIDETILEMSKNIESTSINERLKNQLFIGKVVDEIGLEKTIKLLKESKDVFKTDDTTTN